MVCFWRRSGLVAVLAIAAALVVSRCDGSGDRRREDALTTSSASSPGPANHATQQASRTERPVLAQPAITIEVDGIATGSIDASTILQRPTSLVARDRRAWRLSELLHNTHIPSNAVIHALTTDGQGYTIQDSGRGAGDTILVRRNTGELYIGWLDGDPATRPLADAERPAERIENLSRIAIATPIVPEHLPARLTVLVDGRPHRSLTPDSFFAAATLQLRGQREGTAAAIDVAHTFGSTLELVSITAGGGRVTSPRPTPDARAAIYLTRRGQFKFAWIDPTGAPIAGTKQREVTELALATPLR
jgi:hypothetical protein